MFVLQGGNGLFTFIQIAPFQNNICTIGPGSLDFGKRGLFRHHNGGMDTQILGMEGYGLGMISRRHGDHAFFALLFIQRHHGQIRPARLE